MQNRIVLTLALLLLGACATTDWQRPDTSPAQFAQDSQACEREAEARFPSTPQPPKPLAYETDCAQYGHQNNCATGPGPALASGSRFSQRKAAMQACLIARGYTRP